MFLYLFRTIIIISLLFSFNLSAAKKKDSLNQKDPLMENKDMVLLGEWKLYMDKCGKKRHTNFIQDLAKLSWPDFKTYMAAAGKYTSGGFYSGSCDNDDTQALYDSYDWVISELTYLTGGSNVSNFDDNNIDAELSEIEDVEEKLLKLKELYDGDLISLEEYEEKKSEILDSF